MKRVSRKYRKYSQGEGKPRAAIILANNDIDAPLITPYSDKGNFLLEIQQANEKFYAASIYMDYNATIDSDFNRIEEIITFTKGKKLIIATHSNSRSTKWHDTTTNNREQQMDVFWQATNCTYLTRKGN